MQKAKLFQRGEDGESRACLMCGRLEERGGGCPAVRMLPASHLKHLETGEAEGMRGKQTRCPILRTANPRPGRTATWVTRCTRKLSAIRRDASQLAWVPTLPFDSALRIHPRVQLEENTPGAERYLRLCINTLVFKLDFGTALSPQCPLFDCGAVDLMQ